VNGVPHESVWYSYDKSGRASRIARRSATGPDVSSVRLEYDKGGRVWLAVGEKWEDPVQEWVDMGGGWLAGVMLEPMSRGAAREAGLAVGGKLAVMEDRGRHPQLLDLSREAEQLWHAQIAGHPTEADRRRRRLIRRAKGLVAAEPRNVRAWLLLGDIYTRANKRVACYRRALRILPTEAEAHAELARLFADRGDRRFRQHAEAALRNCAKSSVEESVIYTVLEAAREAQSATLASRAIRLGKARYPKSWMFRETRSEPRNDTPTRRQVSGGYHFPLRALARIRASAHRAESHELCYLVLGQGRKIMRVVQVPNRAPDPGGHHVFGQADWERVRRRKSNQGMKCLGFLHTHPYGPAVPSKGDIRGYRRGTLIFIYSELTKDLRAFRMLGEAPWYRGIGLTMSSAEQRGIRRTRNRKT